jgi:hypothetical protein
MTTKVDSREVGLVAGLNLFSYFLGTRDLHYGLWQDDLEVCIQNLPAAQQRYSEFLISHIPEGVKRILDVGCGAGGLASELLARGYEVEGGRRVRTSGSTRAGSKMSISMTGRNSTWSCLAKASSTLRWTAFSKTPNAGSSRAGMC